MTELLLYGHPDSGHACKVALALELAGLPHRRQFIDIWAPREDRPAGFRAANPIGEVPVLVIDGEPFTQSGAILLELASRFGVLGGAAGLKRGRELIIWEANRIGMCLPQLRAARLFSPQDYPAGALDWLRTRYAADAQRFGQYLGEAPFFHGGAPGIADCAIWGYVQWLPDAGVEPTAAMAGWIARMQALPAMRAPADFFPPG
jgi:glutathione S-transferase